MAQNVRKSREAGGDGLKPRDRLIARSTEYEGLESEEEARKKHPHSIRRTEILRTHPEVVDLFEPYPGTAGWTLALVYFQLISAVLIPSFAPWWITLLFMYSISAVVSHALFVLIHEATHNLVFRNPTLNRICLLIADIPHVLPSAIMFRYYHMLHHIELNRIYKDPDVPYEWEARIVGNSSFRKSVWLLFFFLVQALRTAFYTHRVPHGTEIAWITLNWLVNLGVCTGLVHYVGWQPVAYLLLATAFSIGLHPLGARWIQEHYPTQPYQATYSYYGWVNRVAFGIGYHVEHHDFPSVPWNKLSALKKMAPEYYDTLFSYSSYRELLRDFIFNRKWSLKTRYLVEKKFTEEVTAKADMLVKQKQATLTLHEQEIPRAH